MTTAISLRGTAVYEGQQIPAPAADDPLTDVVAATYESAAALAMSQDTEPGDVQRLALGAAAAAARDFTLHEVLAAFGFAFSGVPLDREEIGDLLDEYAGHAVDTFRQFRDASYTGDVDDLPAPMTALTNLLAVVSGARAVLGMDPSLTAREIIAEDVTTASADELRLHMLGVHGDLNALDVPDRLVGLMHDQAHRCDEVVDDIHAMANGRRRGHDLDDLSWDEGRCRAVVEDVPELDGRDELVAALNAVLARVDAADQASR